MKNLMMMIVSLVFLAATFTNKTAEAAICHQSNVTVDIKVIWEADHLYLCLGGHGNTCRIIVKIPSENELTTSVAEGITATTFPVNSFPIILKEVDQNWNSVDGDPMDINEHTYSPGDPEIIQILQGSFQHGIIIPAQTVVYSSQYNGFIGYAICE